MAESELQSNSPPLLQPGTRRIAVVLLLVFGVQVWLTAGRGYWRNLEPKILLVLLVVCCVPAVARRANALLERVGRLRSRTVVVIGLLVGCLASGYIVYDARRDGRALAPRYQDEFSYLIQAQQVAHGRLWMPAHPLGDFFESFQLLTEPVYASIYFPGTAILQAPGVWLGLPGWVLPVVCAGAAVGMLFVVVTYLFDGVAGVLAAGMLVSLPIFRRMATKPMAQVPALLLGFIAVGCYLRWRRDRRVRFAALAGFFLGWAAITRPVDALCVGIPIGVALAIDLGRAWDRAAVVRTVGAMALAALPFGVIQGALNLGVTGRVDRTPFRHYLDRDLPGTQFGFHPVDPEARPASRLVQKQEYYEHSTRGGLAAHRPGEAVWTWMETRLPVVLTFGTPHPMLLVLAPVGLMAAGVRRRWVLIAVAPAFVGLYYFYPFFFPHYGLLAAPALIVVILASVDAARGVMPRLALFFLAAIVALTVGQFREFNRHVEVDPMPATQLARIDALLAAIPDRAIVLFYYPGGGVYEQEPVFNLDVPWPDEARVIRAHDLGAERNPELFRYYAQRQPDRVVYRYDRGDDSLVRLGNVRELASGVDAPIIPSPKR